MWFVVSLCTVQVVCKYWVCRSRPRLGLTGDGALRSFSRYSDPSLLSLSQADGRSDRCQVTWLEYLIHTGEERDQLFLSQYILQIVLVIYFRFTFSIMLYCLLLPLNISKFSTFS